MKRTTFTLVSLLALPFGGTACDSAEEHPETSDGAAGGKADDVASVIETQSEFFAADSFYVVHVRGWDPNRMSNGSLEDEVCAGDPGLEHAELVITRADPDDGSHCPAISESAIVYATDEFCLRTSGNLTNGTPKSSYKISLEDDELAGMKKLNLKSMWNDVSQMREALAWSMFAEANLPASRHTYGRFCMDPRGPQGAVYRGLFSIIEQVDKRFFDDRDAHFSGQKNGNLYKAYFGDVGPASLEFLGPSGSDYFESSDPDARTYRLQTNEDADDPPELQTYDDLARFIAVVNGIGIGLPEGDPARFDTDEYRAQVEAIFDVYGFLRWAGTNVLIGAWDNYWRTPANYYLYNSGRAGAKNEFMAEPYFHFIPWDYDNSFGIDYFGKSWEDPCRGVCQNSLIEWEKATIGAVESGTDKSSKLPLIRNILANRHFRAYYLDFLEHTLAQSFTTQRVDAFIGTQGSGGTWDRVRQSAFLESDTPHGAPHTGRQFTNDQVFRHGFSHEELRKGDQFTWGIRHYVRMRADRARRELEALRSETPAGSSGARFPASPTPLP